MKKQKIAVIFGGNSTEYEVSYNRQLPSLKISIQKDSIFYQSESIEQATGFTIQENMKALQTILGLKIAPKTALLSYRKTVLKRDFSNFPKTNIP